MLSFYFIADNQSNGTSTQALVYAGGIEEEEFEMGQHLGLIESDADYYGRFRWSSAQVSNKLFLLAGCPMRDSTALQEILKQAEAAQVGLLAFGD